MNYKKQAKLGLSDGEVVSLAAKYGSNEIVPKKPESEIAVMVRQFGNPLVVLLAGAVVLTMFTGHTSDAVLILIAILINTILGYGQERRAVRSLEALRALICVSVNVLRNGRRGVIDAKQLVPGDVVFLSEGEKVPADGILVEVNELTVNESILTGESLPVSKNLSRNGDYSLDNCVYMGTIVSSGLGTMIVTKIGTQTEMGRIAKSTENNNIKTPLEKKIAKLALDISIAVVVVAIVVFTWGFGLGKDWLEMFTIAVALAVSATPEGLVIALTVILAVGAQRMLKRKALVRKLVAAETLGSVTWVCVDKTGTLTRGEMQVSDVDFENMAAGYRAALLANDMRDATELARIEWAREYYLASAESKWRDELVDPEQLMNSYARDESIAFSTERRYLAVRYGREVIVVGAPDLLIGRSNLMLRDKRGWELKLSKLAQEGKRILGFLQKEYGNEKQARAAMADLRNGEEEMLNWVGLMAFVDPVRAGVSQALNRARMAGIKLMVITGDYRETAIAVMKSLGIHPESEEIIEGWELEKMSDAELRRVVGRIVLCARTRPAQKMRIVKALQSQGEVVGMMGDGVNDAPALAAADIGMVVGEATDLAKEAADLVLLDSNFATIVAAIEEGRAIYDNIRKVVTFLLGMAFSEVLVVLGGLLLGWDLALTAVQILWINLVTDGLPYMALTIDPKDKNILRRKPIDARLPLVDGKLLAMIVGMSLLTAGLALATYAWLLPLGLAGAQTGVFIVISLGTLGFALSCRSLDDPIWVERPWENWYLVVSVVAGILLTYAAVNIHSLKGLLKTEGLDLWQWLWVLMSTIIIIGGAELLKLVFKQKVYK